MLTAVPRQRRKTPVADNELVKFSVQLPGHLYNAISKVADDERRALTAQVEVALREWLAARKAPVS